MARTGLVLAITGVLLIMAYILTLTPSQPLDKSVAATSTGGAISARDTTTPVATAREISTTTPYKPQQTPTTTTTERSAVYAPNLEAEVEAPDVINTTRLPLYISYRILIKNTGNATGYIKIDGEEMQIKPGEIRALNKTLFVEKAGVYTVEVPAGSKTVRREIKVLYYAPRLTAEPVYVNATRLPANVSISIVVRNSGNATAWVDGLQIPPMGHVVINKTILVNATGQLVLELGNVTATVYVEYRTPNIRYRIDGPTYFEAIKGEEIPIRFTLANEGNATAVLTLDSKKVELKPGEKVEVVKTVRADRAGVYTVTLRVSGDVNTTLTHSVVVNIIAIRVVFRLQTAPPIFLGEERREDDVTITVDRYPFEAAYTVQITTNATSRNVTLVVNGDRFINKAYLSGAVVLTRDSPSRDVTININGTTYRAVIKSRLTPPVVKIGKIYKIEFTDTRKITVDVTCRYQGVKVSPKVTIYQISGVVTYGDKTEFYGTIRTDKGDGEFSGYEKDGRGVVELKTGGRRAVVYFAIVAGDIVIERIDYDPPDITCEIPKAMMPRYVIDRISPGEYLATTLAERLYSMFAKTEGETAWETTYDGEKVTIVDKSGNTATFNISELSIAGALTVKLYAG